MNRFAGLSWIFAGMILFSGEGMAQAGTVPSAPAEAVAVVKEVEGALEILREGRTLSGESGNPLYAGDELVTGPSDRALIELEADRSLVKITYDTTLRLVVAEAGASSELLLVRGLMWGKKVAAEPVLSIRTPVAVLAVKGTEYFVKVITEDISQVVVKDGKIEIRYDDYAVDAGEMSQVTVKKKKPPLVEGITQELMNEQWVYRFA